MTLFFHRMSLLFPHLNRVAVTGAELLAVCESFGAIVAEIDIENNGYYVRRGSDHFIFINKSLCQLRKLEALAHETAHLCFHTKGATFNARHEQEAFVFSLLCLIPAPKLTDYTFLDENPSEYAFGLWHDRLKVRFLYGV